VNGGSIVTRNVVRLAALAGGGALLAAALTVCGSAATKAGPLDVGVALSVSRDFSDSR